MFIGHPVGFKRAPRHSRAFWVFYGVPVYSRAFQGVLFRVFQGVSARGSPIYINVWSPMKTWGFYNENMGLSNENRGSPMKIWWSPMKIW